MKIQYNRSYKSCMKMLFRAKVKITNMATLELLKLYQTNVTQIPYRNSHVSAIAACVEDAQNGNHITCSRRYCRPKIVKFQFFQD
jgi:hypothetical protein